MELAANKPRDIEDLKISRAYPRNFYKSEHTETILAVIETALLIPENLWPHKESGGEGTDHSTAAFDILRLALKLIADKEGVASKLIATSSDLKKLIRKDYMDPSELPLLHGWRYVIFGEVALGLLEGRYTISLEDNQVKIIKS